MSHFAKTAGNSLSKGILDDNDGLVDNTTDLGHFNINEDKNEFNHV